MNTLKKRKGSYQGIAAGLVITLIIFLISCGGGGDSSEPDSNPNSSRPPNRPSSLIDGYSVDAKIRNADIRVYSVNNALEKTELLGEGRSNNEGLYQIDIAARSQSVLVEATGGSYTEESSGITVTLSGDDVLRAITFYEAGKPISIMVTPFTNLAVALAKFKVKNGTNVNNAVTEATTAISTFVGLDILTTIPKDVTDISHQGRALDAGLQYGFLTAAISMYTKYASQKNNVAVHSLYSSIKFADVMYNDLLADGKLDGSGYTEGNTINNLGLGIVPIDANTYRSLFARFMLAFVDSEKNATTIDIDDLLSYAQALASSTHGIFGSLAPIPVDEEGPDISAIDAEGTIYNGTINYAVSVNDFISVNRVEFSIDGSPKHVAADPENPTFPLDTTVYADGEHIITVNATDALGNVSEVDLSVIFYNSGPGITYTGPKKVKSTSIKVGGTYITNNSGLAELIVMGVNATINDDNTWTANIILAIGQNTVSVKATDGVGNVTNTSFFIGVDLAAPAFTVLKPDDTFLVNYSTDDGTVFLDLWAADATTFPLDVPYNKISLNGLLLNSTNLINNKIPHYAFTAEDVATGGVFTNPEDLIVTMRYRRGNTTLIENRIITPVEGSVYLIPIVKEGLTNDWYLTQYDTTHEVALTATDEAGNSRVQVFRFKARIRTPEVIINVQDLTETISSIPFANRTAIEGTNIEMFQYRFQNSLPDSIYLDTQSTGTSTVVNTVESGVRQNKARLVTREDWRAKFFYTQLYKGPGGEFDWKTSCAGLDSWRDISGLDYNGIQYYEGVVNGNYQDFDEDNPTAPSPTTYSSFYPNVDGFNSNVVGMAFTPIGTENLPQMVPPPPGGGYNTPVGGLGKVAYFRGTWIGCDKYWLNKIEKRNIYSYENQSGYPRNVFSIFDVNGSSTIETFQVRTLERGVVVPLSGYYKIFPNETVIVKKLIRIPSITNYNDTSVADRNSFNSYSEKRYDKTLTYKFDRAFTASLILDIGINLIDEMTATPSIIESSMRTVTLSR